MPLQRQGANCQEVELWLVGRVLQRLRGLEECFSTMEVELEVVADLLIAIEVEAWWSRAAGRD